MGKFTIFKEGGFATLHEVNYNGVPCIQKVLKTEYQINQFQRIQKEYRILQQINHPNIIRVYAVDGASYVMEKADCNLEDYILNFYISEAEKQNIINGIIEGLKVLHSKPLEVVHRDLNPRNILMINGVPKIADLGICKQLNSGTVVTLKADREGLGTFGYMCPAQLNGDEPIYYFDIYALGRIIYFIETNQQPPIAGKLQIGQTKYKALILATEQDNPILIPNIETFIDKQNAIINTHLTPQQAINYFLWDNNFHMTDLVTAFDAFGGINFLLLDDKKDDILHVVKAGDNASINLLADLYSREVEKYTSQRYWTFNRANSMTSLMIDLHIRTRDEVLMNKLILKAFDYSYGFNQFSAMDMFDKFVNHDPNLYDTFAKLMIINDRLDDLKLFRSRN